MSASGGKTWWGRYRTTLLLVAAAVVIEVLPGAAGVLEYDRAALGRGEWWRVLTCHWTHFSVDHFLWDVAVLGLLGALCEERSRRRVVACVVGAAVGIPAAVWVALPGMARYRGLSGIDAALFALLAVLIGREGVRAREWRWAGFAAAGMAAFAAKMGFELVRGSTVFVAGGEAAMIPVPLAHLVGAAMGVAVGLWPVRRPSGAVPAVGAGAA